MATTIVTKKGSGAPAASDLVEGELAVDTTNGRLYTENSSAAVVELGSNPSGNITFGDNGKAIFGAGSDLQIYHDGNHSYLKDAGTGDLYIQGEANVRITDGDGNKMFLGQNDGEVQLYYNGAEKLNTTSTGIDVTGTVTTDGLTSAGDVAITGGSSGSTVLTLTTNALADTPLMVFQRTGGAIAGKLAYEDGNTAMAFGTTTAHELKFLTGNTERMQITSAGNVGIGTSSPTVGKLQVNDGSGAIVAITRTSGATSGNLGVIRFGNTDIDSNLANITAIQDGATTSSALTFETQSAGGSSTERMRIDASGNLLVGTTATDTAAVGFRYRKSLNAISSVADGGVSAYFGRRSSDGDIVTFRKDDATVGSIGTANGDSITIGNSTGNLILYAATVAPASTSAGGASDGAVDLGASGRRFKDLYLSGGAYLGGTAAANKLDDYESGVFVPTVTNANSNMSGITYVSQSAWYQKVGDLVWFRLQVGFSATTIGTGIFIVTGLPYASLNDSRARQTAAVLTYNLDWDASWKQIHTEGVQNTNSMNLLISRDNNTWANLQADDMANGTTYYYQMSGCYVTN